MFTEIFKVVSQTEPVYVQSKKQENGQLAKCNVHLKGIGGEYAEEFYAVAFGENATQKLEPGELVVVSLRFGTHVNQDIWRRCLESSASTGYSPCNEQSSCLKCR